MKKVAFLDRDGALIYEPTDTYQVDSIEKLQVLEGVIEGLQWLQQAGYTLVMITNQDKLGTADFPKPNFDAAHEAMLQQFKEAGITFKKVFICPHAPEDSCLCRKPQTGLVQWWLSTFTLDTKQSFMYGDRDSDVEFAKNVGIKFIHAETNQPFKLEGIKEMFHAK